MEQMGRGIFNFFLFVSLSLINFLRSFFFERSIAHRHSSSTILYLDFCNLSTVLSSPCIYPLPFFFRDDFSQVAFRNVDEIAR